MGEIKLYSFPSESAIENNGPDVVYSDDEVRAGLRIRAAEVPYIRL